MVGHMHSSIVGSQNRLTGADPEKKLTVDNLKF